jgi:hypothetical protein
VEKPVEICPDCPRTSRNPGKLLIPSGGEGGIRTLNSLCRSACYRFDVPKDAKFATLALGHCPVLPAGTGEMAFPGISFESRQLPLLLYRQN